MKKQLFILGVTCIIMVTALILFLTSTPDRPIEESTQLEQNLNNSIQVTEGIKAEEDVAKDAPLQEDQIDSNVQTLSETVESSVNPIVTDPKHTNSQLNDSSPTKPSTQTINTSQLLGTWNWQQSVDATGNILWQLSDQPSSREYLYGQLKISEPIDGPSVQGHPLNGSFYFSVGCHDQDVHTIFDISTTTLATKYLVPKAQQDWCGPNHEHPNRGLEDHFRKYFFTYKSNLILKGVTDSGLILFDTDRGVTIHFVKVK